MYSKSAHTYETSDLKVPEVERLILHKIACGNHEERYTGVGNPSESDKRIIGCVVYGSIVEATVKKEVDTHYQKHSQYLNNVNTCHSRAWSERLAEDF